MAFCSRIGSLMRQGKCSNFASAPVPVHSMLNAIRSMSSTKLFIGGLSFGTNDESLRDAFASFGDVVEVHDLRVYERRPKGVLYMPEVSHN